jgi:F0F1-type ATP synthase assembly protein I
MDLLRERRELNQGLGDAFATAFELAATTGIFLGLGWLLDRWLGTAPLFMVALTLFCIIGKSVLLLATYNERMKRHEAERLQRSRGQGVSAAGPAAQSPAGAEPR